MRGAEAVTAGAGSEIVVEYAGTRVALEGRVREIVRLLMRDGERMHLEDAVGIAFDWGSRTTSWRVTLRGGAASLAAHDAELDTGGAYR